MSSLSFFVKVEGQAHSNHRNPQGVYAIEVLEEKTPAHSAVAAAHVARESVPFLNENPDCFILRVFTSDGTEVLVPRTLNTTHEEYGRFGGRAKSYPEIITLQ
jgi:hypothetical protein